MGTKKTEEPKPPTVPITSAISAKTRNKKLDFSRPLVYCPNIPKKPSKHGDI